MRVPSCAQCAFRDKVQMSRFLISTPCIVWGGWPAAPVGARAQRSLGVSAQCVFLCSQRIAPCGNRHLGVRVACGVGAFKGARLRRVSAKDSKWMLILGEFTLCESCVHASACPSRQPWCSQHCNVAKLERFGLSVSNCKLGTEAPAPVAKRVGLCLLFG